MRRLSTELDQALFDAEHRGRCLHPSTPSACQALNRRVAAGSGDVVRPAPGLFAHSDHWASLKPDEQALYVARGMQDAYPERVFCGRTAALAWGLPLSYARLGPICAVTEGRGRAARGEGVAWHHIPHNANDQPTVVNGLRVTSLSRTALDCLRTLPFPDGLAVADCALRKAHASSYRMRRRMEELGRGQRGIRRAIGVMSYSDARSESWAESVARALVITQGFAIPDLQRELPQPLDPSRVYRIDMVWTLRDGRLVLCEVDGYKKYEDASILRGQSTARALADEQHRESQLTLYRHPILRISTRDLANTRRFVEKLAAYGIPRDPLMPQAIRELAAQEPRASLFLVVMPSSVPPAPPPTPPPTPPLTPPPAAETTD